MPPTHSPVFPMFTFSHHKMVRFFFFFEENHLMISDYRNSCTGCFSFVVVNVIFSLYVQFFSFVTLRFVEF